MIVLAVDLKNTFFNTSPNAAKIGVNPGTLISILLPNVVIVAGLIFFVMIIFSGISLVLGAGKQRDAQSAAKARNALTYSIVGFLIVVAGYFILQIVGAMLGINFTQSFTFQ